MNVLVITNLFPNSIEQTRGIFNFQQIRRLTNLNDIALRVIAPLPWYYRGDIPGDENFGGIQVSHPRYFMFPKFGRSFYGYFFYRALREPVKQLYRNFNFDIILATWVYPDGYGSYLLAKELGKPIIIKAHGSDINAYTNYTGRRKKIAAALNGANKVIAVSKGLKEKIAGIGVSEDKIALLYNGINTKLFHPLDLQACREELNIPKGKKVILYAGNFVQGKGIEHLIEAFLQKFGNSPEYFLCLTGGGILKKKLVRKVNAGGMKDNVLFVDRLSHDKMPVLMNACDVFCLPSLNEGCPNVILEAMACGKPVVGSNVGGIPELITAGKTGLLTKPADPASLAQVLENAVHKNWDAAAIRASVEKLSWEENALTLKKILEESI